jgi:sugar lactone lactonase YvrE
MARKSISQLFNRKPGEGRPEISTIEPQAAIPGGEIVIRGAGFAADHDRPRVDFGEVEAPVVISTDNFLIARVPDGATANTVTVRTAQPSNPFEFHLGVPIADNLHPVANPAIDTEGNIYVTFSGSRGQKVPVSLFKIDLNYKVSPFSSEILNPTGLAFDRAGNLYVSSRNDGTVFRVASNGAAATWAEGMGIATGLAFDPAENLYVGDRSGTIFKIGRDRQIFVFTTMEPSIAAFHLAFGPDRYLYVTGPTTSSFDNVYRVSPAGQVEVFYRGLGRPQGMAFDLEGNLYLAASLAGRKGIVRISPDRRAQLAISGTGLVGLAFAPSGALVLASTNAVFNMDWPVKGWPLLP